MTALTPDSGIEYQSGRGSTMPEIWVMALNRYQRDNLLWLLQAMGYGAPAIEPLHLAHTGDWVGEIANMLGTEHWNEGKRSVEFIPQRPNRSRIDLDIAMARWRRT